ncbi:MAG TPA: glycoside hydrolase family 18 protein [Terracidiphilus sp.]|nr:glycoside hydrolase family 18 protein [Terracidiphilus sp.]
MKNVVLSNSRLVALACICLSSAMCAAASAPNSNAMIVAYVFPRDNPILPGEIAAQKLTRINYAFANINDGRIVDGYSHDNGNLTSLVALKQENPSLTVLVSVGGWLWSGGFSDMALTKRSRAIFISSVADYVTLHQLDGLDIDWEFPGMQGATSHFRAEDKQNYTLLLKELRSRFDKMEGELHRTLYLTVATGADSDWLSHTEMKKVAKYVDTVNLMAYDYYEPDVDAVTGNHAPLYTDPADPKKISDDNSIQEYEKAGVPAAKIVLGVPFYAHVWGQVPAANHGLFQPGKEIPHGYAGYGDGPQAMLKNGFIRYWDPIAAAPYLYNTEKQVFVSYDDPESIALKCKYVLAHKLRGIMFWSYESDTTGGLLNAVNDGLNKMDSTQGGNK